MQTFHLSTQVSAVSDLHFVMNTKHHQNPVRFSSQTWKGHSVSQKAQILHETGPWENTLEILRKKILKQ